MLEGREPTKGAFVAQLWENFEVRKVPRALNSKVKYNGKLWTIIARAGSITTLRNHYLLERSAP